MTREEIQAEINRLQDELRTVLDNLNDAIRSLPECRRDDQRERRQVFRKGQPLGDIRHLDLLREQRMNTFIGEYREKRDKLKAEIEGRKTQLRSQPKPQTADSPRITGVVKWYNPTKEFGFIHVDGQSDVWVPKSSLMESTSLETGDKVTFKRIQGPKGFKAVDVRYFTE